MQPDIRLEFGWRAAFRIAIAIAIVNIALGLAAWVVLGAVLSSFVNGLQ